MNLSGVWVPVITPFVEGRVDERSLRSLVERLIGDGVSGLVALGTTGECPAVSFEEHLEVARIVKDAAERRVPVLAGAGGPDTRHVVTLMRHLEELEIDGFLSVCPYYNRPNQAGLRAHFDALATATTLPIVLYNIPYRTGVNLENDTVRALAEHDNIIGIKDSCGNVAQSMELLQHRPRNFSVLTGEDALFFAMLALGADGGILAAAHYDTKAFVSVWQQMLRNNHVAARETWHTLTKMVALLFSEPNPAPLKQLLFAQGRIASPEVRLPLVRASDALRELLEAALRERHEEALDAGCGDQLLQELISHESKTERRAVLP
jgi:4-hydroxy-tetrahydrodipicolinate synthase